MSISSLVRLLISLFVAFVVLAQSDKPHCVVESSNGKSDDSPAIKAAFTKCASNGVIEFKAGVDYNVWTPITHKLNNVDIRVNGNLHLPNSIIKVLQITNGRKVTWFQFSGANVHWIGSSNEKYGWINSYGQQWYDANPPGKTGLEGRPHLFRWAVNQGTVRHFKSRKPMGWNVGISGDNNLITDAIIDAVSSTSAFPFNTDAFGVGARNVTIKNSYILNGDDALAIQNGAHDILFENNTIGYQTHGMSVGSLGGDPNSPADVSNIMFKNITVKGGLYAARFKSWKGGKGLVQNVTWSNIRLENVTFPIFVTQTYQNQALGQQSRPSGQAVRMKDFTWSNFSGTINTQNPGDGSCVKPCWYNDGLPTLRHTEAVILGCDSATSCQNFVLKNINLEPAGGNAHTTQICMNAKSDLNPRLGIGCSNGTFRAI
ncbi:putative exopolygalacturonase C [Microthyrium microscopicum]|uniref:galacturonan 1,4-alpha-galacturonidase n=1 Tax=Microthyrium microscopicum TaxID=703497 RepID=A0A6A6UBW6_9PEZI|nr:putative exopolygalacturonase C [Microthyrium microscopicum]